MAKDENGAAPPSRRDRRKSESESEPDPDSDSDTDEQQSRKSEGNNRKRSKNKKKSSSSNSKRKRSRDSDSYTSSSEYDDESSNSESGDSENSDSRRRRRKKMKRREEDKKERRRRREKEKEKKRKRKEDEKKRRKKKKDKKEKGKKGAVTNSWGKYGIIKETDMWNKRPEFTAWLLEVKQVNLESLPTWEEKQLFKDFMEDHNTATFPSKKYYNLDAYYQHKMEKDMKKGFAKVQESERTIFNDEEQRRLELQREREKHKEQEVEALKRSMQGGMAQAMKEQAQLREEMAYHFKLGNFEAAAAIQRRLDPDVAM